MLAHYLTAPILQLQIAARQLAAGRLSTRAVLSLRWRKDEIGDLVQDFNEMAERMEELVSRQRQLIYDISHELRSPLARLNVALDLGRQRKGSDPAFDRMERDIDCLNEMIGRLLTLARLDAAAAPVEMSSVDMTELVAQIVHDAGFESKKRNVIVRLTADEDCVVQGNAGLLHSAIENVVRNAVLYTVPDSAVEVVLEHSKTGDTDCINLSILDQGPGVAESDLERIFRPFYRTTEARDRASGGAGLGLAIADRVIHTHGGTIRARNTNGKGLEVRISLPSLRGLT
ncbi:MAG: ATP-binding protein [Terracidiphilus sp.]